MRFLVSCFHVTNKNNNVTWQSLKIALKALVMLAILGGLWRHCNPRSGEQKGAQF